MATTGTTTALPNLPPTVVTNDNNNSHHDQQQHTQPNPMQLYSGDQMQPLGSGYSPMAGGATTTSTAAQLQHQQQHGAPSVMRPNLTNSDPNSTTSAAAVDGVVVPTKHTKVYPTPQYRWDPGEFSSVGPRGMCLCAPDGWHGIIIAIIGIVPCVVFLASIRASSDWVSFIVVPILLVATLGCLIGATSVDPGIYRKRIITEADRMRVRRQQRQRENVLRAKRGLPLLAVEEGFGANTCTADAEPNAHRHPMTSSSGVAPNVPMQESATHTNTTTNPHSGTTVVEVSDEEHPNRLSFDRKAFISVPGPNHDKYKVECSMCTACGIMRNPRVGHCFHCNVCVDEFDHHCGVLGSCVGKRNFRFFAGFMYATTFLSLYLGARTIHVLATDIDWSEGASWDFNSGRFRIIAAALVIMGCLCGACTVLPMMCVYIRYAAINTTQKEEANIRSYHNARTPMPLSGSSQQQQQIGASTSTSTATTNGGASTASSSVVPTPSNDVLNPYATNMVYDYFTRMFGPIGASRADAWEDRGKKTHPTADR